MLRYPQATLLSCWLGATSCGDVTAMRFASSVARLASSSNIRMMSDATSPLERIAKIQNVIDDLREQGVAAEALAPLQQELRDLEELVIQPPPRPLPPPPSSPPPIAPPAEPSGLIFNIAKGFFDVAATISDVAAAPFVALGSALDAQIASNARRAEARRRAAAAFTAEEEKLRREEEALSPVERATRELLRAFEGGDLAQLSAAVEAGEAAGLSVEALRPARERCAELEAAAALDAADYQLLMATRRANTGGRAELTLLIPFVEEAAAVGVTGETMRVACELLDKKRFGDGLSANARRAAAAPPNAARVAVKRGTTTFGAPAQQQQRGQQRQSAQPPPPTTAPRDEAAVAAMAARAALEAEIGEASQAIKDSVRLSGPERKKVLRSLQAKWHPDRQVGDGANKELATELMMKINEATRIAKANAKARGESW